MNAEVEHSVAVVDLRGRAVDWPSVAAEVEHLRSSSEVNVVVLAVDGVTELSGADLGVLARFARFELPVVVALAGTVSGAAVDLALAGDIRVCDRSLQLALPGSNERLGLLLRATGGAPVATARALSADEALACGLVSRVAAEGESAVDLARKVAAIISGRGPIATRLGKEAIWRGLAMPLEQALRFETDLTLLLQTTKDRAEGVRAFLEKRAPTFEGE